MECKSVGCSLCDRGVYGCLCGSKVDECITCSHKDNCPMREEPPVLTELCRECYAKKCRQANHNLFKHW